MGDLRKTSFGSLEVLCMSDDKVIAELAIFTSNGNNHLHDRREMCYVLSGEGRIYQQDAGYKEVKEGSVIYIAADTGHWMEVDKDQEMKILIVYADKRT